MATVSLTNTDGEINVLFNGPKSNKLPDTVAGKSFTLLANFAANDGTQAIKFTCSKVTGDLGKFLPSSLECPTTPTP